jgi:glycosyltransferase involved in cell wall biosynthesis
MKPNVMHLVSGHSMGWTGGINATLHSLMQSRLAAQVDFEAFPLQTFLANPPKHRQAAIVVHAASSWRGLRALWQLKRFGPLVIAEHHYCANFETFNVPSPARFHWMLRSAYGLADRVIAVSQAQRDWMLQHRLVAPHKIVLIQSCRVVDAFLAVSPKPRQPDRPFVLGAYGRLCPQKGFDVLIRAIQRLSDPNVQLKIGGSGPDEAALHQLAQGCPTIEFLGRIDDVPTFLSQCDAVVIPSRWEPWGNVCLEARAAATPVLAAAVDGLPEQIQNSGILVSPNHPEALAEGIQTLARMSAQELALWGQQGRLSAQSAWDTYLDRWQGLIEGVR